MSDKHKQLILVAVGLGVVGSVAYFGFGVSLASLSIGLYSVSLFAMVYLGLITDAFLAGGMINSAKSIRDLRLCEKMEKKYPQMHELYTTLFKQQQDLLTQIQAQVNLPSSAKMLAYRALLKEQKSYNAKLKSVESLSAEEQNLFQKYALLKGPLQELHYEDAQLDTQLKSSKQKRTAETENGKTKKQKVSMVQTIALPPLPPKPVPEQAKTEAVLEKNL